MSIIDSRADRRQAGDRIDRMKVTIADLQLEIDRCFLALPVPPLAVQQRLAELDVHLSRASQELGAAQVALLQLP